MRDLTSAYLSKTVYLLFNVSVRLSVVIRLYCAETVNLSSKFFYYVIDSILVFSALRNTDGIDPIRRP